MTTDPRYLVFILAVTALIAAGLALVEHLDRRREWDGIREHQAARSATSPRSVP